MKSYFNSALPEEYIAMLTNRMTDALSASLLSDSKLSVLLCGCAVVFSFWMLPEREGPIQAVAVE